MVLDTHVLEKHQFCPAASNHSLNELCHGEFDLFGTELSQIKTNFLCHTQNTQDAYGTLWGGYHYWAF